MDKSELIELIRMTFRGVSRHGGVSLHETEVIDNYGTDEERLAARKKDRDGRWQDVPHEDLAEVCGIGGISFFDPIGWRYYLPAYMTWILAGGAESDSCASDFLFYSLIISRKSRGYDLPRFESLDLAQKQTVKAFLEFVSNGDLDVDYYVEDAKKALVNYWDSLEETY